MACKKTNVEDPLGCIEYNLDPLPFDFNSRLQNVYGRSFFDVRVVTFGEEKERANQNAGSSVGMVCEAIWKSFNSN